MHLSRWPRIARGGLALLALCACSQSFRLSRFRTNDALYQAAMREFGAGRWDHAVQAFEKLTLELPARDSLLPRSYYYLATAHARKDEHLLAAQAYSRLTETFPDDTLADDALLAAAREYAKMWRRPELDAQYGHTALATYRTLPELYPDSPLVPQAEAGVNRLLEWLATKDYETGMHYVRRKAPDSAIIYFRDVIENYPTTARARDAYLRLVEVYRSINYREDVKDTCATLHQKYPGDREVRDVCGPALPTAVAQPTP
jgi:outer membrane protein assembly factor BamD